MSNKGQVSKKPMLVEAKGGMRPEGKHIDMVKGTTVQTLRVGGSQSVREAGPLLS
jgi:hypothetical protein